MATDDAGKTPPAPHDRPRGAGAARAWERFRRQLLEPTATDPDVAHAGADADDAEIDEAFEDIAALKDGRATPGDVDPRAVARWIQLFGKETLRAMLGLTEADDPPPAARPGPAAEPRPRYGLDRRKKRRGGV